MIKVLWYPRLHQDRQRHHRRSVLRGTGGVDLHGSERTREKPAGLQDYAAVLHVIRTVSRNVDCVGRTSILVYVSIILPRCRARAPVRIDNTRLTSIVSTVNAFYIRHTVKRYSPYCT